MPVWELAGEHFGERAYTERQYHEADDRGDPSNRSEIPERPNGRVDHKQLPRGRPNYERDTTDYDDNKVQAMFGRRSPGRSSVSSLNILVA